MVPLAAMMRIRIRLLFSQKDMLAPGGRSGGDQFWGRAYILKTELITLLRWNVKEE